MLPVEMNTEVIRAITDVFMDRLLRLEKLLVEARADAEKYKDWWFDKCNEYEELQRKHAQPN